MNERAFLVMITLPEYEFSYHDLMRKSPILVLNHLDVNKVEGHHAVLCLLADVGRRCKTTKNEYTAPTKKLHGLCVNHQLATI